MLMFDASSKSLNESGSALVYILIAIALLAALTFTFMEPSSQQTSSQNTFKTVTAMQSQVDMIRSSIQECILSYPKGDKCINGDAAAYCTTAAVTDTGARENYPIDPNSDHYTNATPGKSGDQLVRNIRCPGNNGGDNADHDNHGFLFGGDSGKFLPPKPDLFEEWQYYNGNDGVFFWTYTDKTDAFVQSSLDKLDDTFSECEADVVTGGAAVYLDSDDGFNCAANTLCFRVRMITTGSATWEGDTDGDESGC